MIIRKLCVLFFLSTQTCSEACGALGAVYIGAFDGDMCGCGSKEGYLLEQKPAGTCDALCVGEATGDAETCGGSVSFDLLLINYLATEDDYFGKFCFVLLLKLTTAGARPTPCLHKTGGGGHGLAKNASMH